MTYANDKSILLAKLKVGALFLIGISLFLDMYFTHISGRIEDYMLVHTGDDVSHAISSIQAKYPGNEAKLRLLYEAWMQNH